MMRSLVIICFLTLISFSCSNKDSEQGGGSIVDQEVRGTESFRLPKLPEYVTFCGDTLLLDDFDLKERLDKELIVNTFYHSSTIQAFKRANRYFPYLSEILMQEDIPDDMKFLCLIESNLTQAVSPSGAKGFWQFMPQTAKEFGLKINSEIDERLDVRKSTVAATKYLRGAFDEFKDWYLTAASYNYGIGGIRNAINQQGTDNYFDLYLNSETSRYVFRILAMKLIFANPESYGFQPEELELYEEVETKEIMVTSTIDDLISWSKDKGSNFRKLKVLNPWIRGNRLTLHGDTLYIELPV